MCYYATWDGSPPSLNKRIHIKRQMKLSDQTQHYSEQGNRETYDVK